MLKVRPVLVNNVTELEKAVSKDEKIIILTNENLFEQIKKKVNKDVSYKKKTGAAVKVSAAVTVASLIGSSVFPILAIPCVIGAYATIASGMVKLSDALVAKLRKYSWREDKQQKILILTKFDGTNKFDSKKEEIDFSMLSK